MPRKSGMLSVVSVTSAVIIITWKCMASRFCESVFMAGTEVNTM